MFNIMFSIMSTQCIQSLNDNSSRVKKNRKLKKCVVALSIFVMFVYIVAITIQSNSSSSVLKGMEKIIVNLSLLICPYALYIINAFLNLFLYSDLVFVREIMSQIMEKDYFLSSEEEFEKFIT